MRMLFLGAGGTGGYFGGRAAEAGADVTFLVREPRAELLRKNGLVIKSPRGDVTLQPQLATAQTLKGHYDLVVLSCKAYDLDSAIDAIKPAVGSGTTVLPIMNGMSHYDVLERTFGAHSVLGGLCQIAATMGAHGEVVHMGQFASFVFGERAGEARSARCEALEKALQGVNFSVKLSKDIHQDNWEKFVFLCSLASATCLMRGSVGEIASTSNGVDIMLALLAECQAVSAASGHAVRPDADAAARKLFTDPSQPITASMFRDLKQGQRVEADHIVGDMVHRGQMLDIPTPYLRAAYTNLQVYQAQRAS